MFSTFKEAHDYVRAQQIELVDLLYCDLWGHLHHLTLAAREFTQDVVTEGIGFDSSSVGFKHAMPYSAVQTLAQRLWTPFHSQPTLACLCGVYEADTELYQFDPREIARRAEKWMISTGIADKSLWGPEFAFYIFDQIPLKNSPALFAAKSFGEANWGTLVNPNGYALPDNQAYQAARPATITIKSGTRLWSRWKSSAYQLKYHHHEVGGPGQSEIETPLASPKRATRRC